MKSYRLSLHIFRRDLRLADNTALLQALASSESVICAFILDKRQIDANPYKSVNALQFMCQSLDELRQDLRAKKGELYYFAGTAEDSLKSILKLLPIEAVFFNRDYTPFSRKRDKQLAAICHDHGIDCHTCADTLLHEPADVLKADGTPYTIFTPYLRKARLLPVAAPKNNRLHHYYHSPIKLARPSLATILNKQPNRHLAVNGGRSEGLSLLKKINRLKNYAVQRDFPALAATTHLSAHIKFGTISIRECYAAVCSTFGENHTLIHEFLWRDFFTHIGYHFPRVFGHSFHSEYDQIEWSQNRRAFQAWCQGMTGFPIVDAGMRELNTTGYMHNRVRMITASFLCKDLHLDWRWGEKYFAQQLVDYDPAVNNGNWQWAASTGCDAQPYFRIFNPWLQQRKFDPDCLYIKKWIPELAKLPVKTIQTLNLHHVPMLDHAVESQLSKLLYRNASGKTR